MTEHCNSTCQLHENTDRRVEILEEEVHGKDGLNACTAKMLETLTTVKNLMYGMVGTIALGVLIGILNLVLKSPVKP